MIRKRLLAVALVSSLTVTMGAFTGTIHHKLSQAKGGTPRVLLAQNEPDEATADTGDPDLIEQGPDGDGDVQG